MGWEGEGELELEKGTRGMVVVGVKRERKEFVIKVSYKFLLWFRAYSVESRNRKVSKNRV